MKRLWQRYAERVDQMTLRERVLVFASAMLMLVALVYVLFIDAEVQRQKRLSSTLVQRQAEAKTLQDQLTKVLTSRASDPDRQLRERLARLRSQLGDIEARIRDEERKFTTPAQMRTVIDELLARNSAVQLIAMKSLPTTSVADTRSSPPSKGEQMASPADRLVYRHGIEITVSGAYLDLLEYIRQLERLPTQLYWSSLQLDASTYPRSTMKVVVYTLSLDPRWLSV